MCVLSIPYLRGICEMRKWLKGFKTSWVPSMRRYSLEGSHSSRCAEMCARVQYRTLLFCQRPACAMSGTLCAHLLEEPDTGVVVEKWTCSICPEAAARCGSVDELTVSTPPLGSFRSTLLCLLHKGLQATERPPRRSTTQSSVTGCRVPLQRCYSLPFAAKVSSMASPQQLTAVCALSFFSRDPSCPGRLLFYIWKSRASAQSLSYQLQVHYCCAASDFCLGLPRCCAERVDTPSCVTAAAGPAAGWVDPMPSLRRSTMLC